MLIDLVIHQDRELHVFGDRLLANRKAYLRNAAKALRARRDEANRAVAPAREDKVVADESPRRSSGHFPQPARRPRE